MHHMNTNEPACGAGLIEDGSCSAAVREEIAISAFSIYLRRGSPQGDDVRNWLDAEAQVRAKHASTVFVRPHAQR